MKKSGPFLDALNNLLKNSTEKDVNDDNDDEDDSDCEEEEGSAFKH